MSKIVTDTDSDILFWELIDIKLKIVFNDTFGFTLSEFNEFYKNQNKKKLYSNVEQEVQSLKELLALVELMDEVINFLFMALTMGWISYLIVTIIERFGLGTNRLILGYFYVR